MDTLLELIHEFRILRTRSNAGDLDADGRARLVGLRQLLGDDSAWKETRARNGQGIYPVRFTVGGAFEEGSLQLLNGAGVVIAARHVPDAGGRLLVRLDGEREDVSYLFPASVSWSRPGRLGVFGALFDGASERTDLHEGWATSMRLGDGALVPMVA